MSFEATINTLSLLTNNTHAYIIPQSMVSTIVQNKLMQKNGRPLYRDLKYNIGIKLDDVNIFLLFIFFF